MLLTASITRRCAAAHFSSERDRSTGYLLRNALPATGITHEFLVTLASSFPRLMIGGSFLLSCLCDNSFFLEYNWFYENISNLSTAVFSSTSYSPLYNVALMCFRLSLKETFSTCFEPDYDVIIELHQRSNPELTQMMTFTLNVLDGRQHPQNSFIRLLLSNVLFGAV